MLFNVRQLAYSGVTWNKSKVRLEWRWLQYSTVLEIPTWTWAFSRTNMGTSEVRSSRLESVQVTRRNWGRRAGNILDRPVKNRMTISSTKAPGTPCSARVLVCDEGGPVSG